MAEAASEVLTFRERQNIRHMVSKMGKSLEDNNTMEALLTAKQAATSLKMHYADITKALAAGTLKGEKVKSGNKSLWRVTTTEVEKYRATRKTKKHKEAPKDAKTRSADWRKKQKAISELPKKHPKVAAQKVAAQKVAAVKNEPKKEKEGGLREYIESNIESNTPLRLVTASGPSPKNKIAKRLIGALATILQVISDLVDE